MHVTIIYGCCGQSSKADIVVDIMVFAVEPVTNHLFSAPGTLMMARNGTGVITTWFHIRMVLMGKWTKRLGKLDHTFHDSILEILRLERINYFLWTNKKKNLNFKTILWYKIIQQNIRCSWRISGPQYIWFTDSYAFARTWSPLWNTK